MEVPLTVGNVFEKGTICRTLKRLKLLDEPVAAACVCVCVYVCACSLLYGCYIPAGFLPLRLALSPGWGALPPPLSSNVAGRLPSACSTLPLSLSSNPSPADCRLMALLKRSRAEMCCFWRWASARALSLDRCCVFAVVYIPQEIRPLLANGWY